MPNSFRHALLHAVASFVDTPRSAVKLAGKHRYPEVIGLTPEPLAVMITQALCTSHSTARTVTPPSQQNACHGAAISFVPVSLTVTQCTLHMQSGIHNRWTSVSTHSSGLSDHSEMSCIISHHELFHIVGQTYRAHINKTTSTF